MTTVLFVGPTLSRARAKQLLPEAHLHGPAACGDVYRAFRRGAKTILLVDGYFDHRLAVWHKEILWALAHGVRVGGAASMGALRAAELEAFGMDGIGKIYELYRCGEVEDDDEVTVLHQDAARGFQSQSDAMVNLRFTLHAAVADRVLDPVTESRLIAAAKRLYYGDRSFRALLQMPELDAEQREALAEWLTRHGAIDQKRLDAEALLSASARGAFAGPPLQKFKFESTNPWNALKRRIDAEDDTSASQTNASVQQDHGSWKRWASSLQSEAPARYAELWTRSIERALALALAEVRGLSPSLEQIQRESELFRRSRGLLTPDQTDAWLRHNELDVAGFSKFAHDLALGRLAADEVERAVLRVLPEVARELGIFSPERWASK